MGEGEGEGELAIMPDFRGKVALVTGVGRVGQIGHAIAQGLGRAGAKLVLADRAAEMLTVRVREFAAEGVTARLAAGDLTVPDAARAAVAVATREFGGLDVVVNVAGGLFSFGDFLQLKPEQVELELAANVKTAVFVSQAAIPALIARGGGAIVNFSSIAVLRPLAQMAAYSAAKWAVAGLTRALAREFRDQRVRVNAVAPTAVRTTDNVAQMKPDAQTRLVELADLVAAVLFLASDEAQGVSGQILPVTGKDV